MHKYAAVTALAIALITMLDAETASAASTRWCGIKTGSLSCTCDFRCAAELWNTAKLWDRTSFIQNKPLRDACRAKCVAAKEARITNGATLLSERLY
jgi:hypothetical protein